MEALSSAVLELRDNDSAVFISRIEETRIETRLRLTKDDIEFLLTQETIRSENELVLLVKKPDYLGNSKWEFRYNDRSIEAKILDQNWLERFRHAQISWFMKACFTLRDQVAFHVDAAPLLAWLDKQPADRAICLFSQGGKYAKDIISDGPLEMLDEQARKAIDTQEFMKTLSLVVAAFPRLLEAMLRGFVDKYGLAVEFGVTVTTLFISIVQTSTMVRGSLIKDLDSGTTS
jgi:hypothetical protein